MGFPDRIERSISVAHPPAKVWEAITTAEGLGTWFGHKASVDLRVGGLAQLTFEGGHSAELRIERHADDFHDRRPKITVSLAQARLAGKQEPLEGLGSNDDTHDRINVYEPRSSAASR